MTTQERTSRAKLLLAFAKADYEMKKFRLAYEYASRLLQINMRR